MESMISYPIFEHFQYGVDISYKVSAHVMYVPDTWLKNVITRIMTIYEKRIFQELLEIIRVIPINYTLMDLKAF
jgi:hypothetical protein